MPDETRTEPVVVTVDKALKKRWLAALLALGSAIKEGAAAWHKKYLTAAAIIEHSPPLYLAGGYSTDYEFIEKEMLETRQGAYRNMRVAKLSTAAEVAKFTASRLAFGIAFLEAKKGSPIEGRAGIDFEALRIQYKLKGKPVSKRLIDAKREDLVEALAQMTGNRKKKNSSPLAKEVLSAVERSGVEGANANVTKTQITLRIPIAGLTAVVRELAEIDPVSE